ncbi:hypothetical protein HK105_204435 [Polyrhizophydium stewartii]|uniref:Mediator of RNA polymerase II transcription subunit 1 n=1 Tax=Polyrhizophydium stewartii TaxID=2732419 RepID=A0ABR4N904_9FUNG
MATPTLDVLERLLCDALEAQRRGELHPLGAAAPLEGRREWSRRLTALAGSVRAAAYQPPTAGKPARQALAFAAEALQPLQAALQGCVAAAAEHSTAGNTRRVLERAVELACADLGIQHLATEPLDAGSASTVTLSRKLAQFKATLASLVFLDSRSVPGQVDLFQCMAWIERDLRAIHEAEMQAARGDDSRVLMDGHGLPRFHDGRWGPAIDFWRSPSAGSGDRTLSALVAMEDAPPTAFPPAAAAQFLAVPGTVLPPGMQTVPVTSPLLAQGGVSLMCMRADPAVCPSAPATFVLRLDSALLVTLDSARELAALCGIVDADQIIDDSDAALAGPQARGQMRPFAEALLDSFGLPSEQIRGMRFTQRSKLDDSSSWPDGLAPSFTWSAHSAAATALRVQRVPFASPAALLPALQILRMHVAFEQLVRSAFSEASRDTHVPAYERRTFDVVHCDAPRAIGVSVLLPRPPVLFQIRIAVDAWVLGLDVAVVECLSGHAAADGAVAWQPIDIRAAEAAMLRDVVVRTQNLPLVASEAVRVLLLQ